MAFKTMCRFSASALIVRVQLAKKVIEAADPTSKAGVQDLSRRSRHARL
jgi:hypothetical protein